MLEKAKKKLECSINPYTVKAIEAIEGCSMEEFIEKIGAVLELEADNNANKDAWLEHYPGILQAYHIQEMLQISESTAYQVLHHNKCPSVTLGRRVFVPRDAFWQFIQDHHGKPLW